jgi:undecaprenyl diphosphate synthase
LRHLLVAGGSVAQWQVFSEQQWQSRLDDLLDVARQARVAFVTVHPHDATLADTCGGSRSTPNSLTRRTATREGVHVVIDPVVDGRERIRDVVASWPNKIPLTEKRLGKALFGEAGEPDLVVILGPPNCLPNSLVWELAYGELVFVEAGWTDLGVDHLRRTVDEYARRQRRFGGVE